LIQTCGLVVSWLLAVFVLLGCDATPAGDRSIPTQPTGSSPDRVIAATITDIPRPSVWVRPLEAAEVLAREQMGLQVGETVRTEAEALAEVKLENGLAFRLAGNTILTLQPQNQLNLTGGEMITWVQPGRQVPAEIVTPEAIAGIQGTTVFARISSDVSVPVLLFSWEGNVTVRLPGQTEEILLSTGEEVTIPRGERNIERVRQRVRQLTPEEFRQRRQQSRLFQTFQQPLPTLSAIEQFAPE
jgi:hypothetical protein